MKGAQLGFTEAGNNWVGYVIHHSPGPMLYVQPTVDLAKKASKERIAPMISDSRELSSLVAEPKTRYGSNTILQKDFPGGVLIMTGANSAVGLRHTSIRNLFCDEVDGYPPNVGGEGDPLDLALRRTATFEDSRKVFIVSTPTVKGFSRIEKAFEESDQRRYEVPCPHCDHYQVIAWSSIRWPDGHPEDAALVCLECGAEIDESHKGTMLAKGRWTPTATGDGRTRGYHLSALYSPPGWYSWGSAARDFVAANARGREALQTWVNTVLGETWEEEGLQVDEEVLASRVERYPERVPAGAVVLTCGVDVQDNRLELEVVGWGPGEESWGIEYRVLWGDPRQEQVWTQLSDFLETSFPHEYGISMPIAAVCVDSGHCTQQVYRFCKGRQTRRVFAVKGSGESGKPVVESPRHKRTGFQRRPVELFIVGTDQASGIVQGRLRVAIPGPGYCHFPAEGHGYNHEYFRQLTSMKAVLRYHHGVPKRLWTLMTGRKNEAFDTRVYSLAALYILNPAWNAIAKRLASKKSSPDAPPTVKPVQTATPKPPAPANLLQKPARAPMRRPRGNWVSGWR
jgi:phage terminase large subunit GpA-like protein